VPSPAWQAEPGSCAGAGIGPDESRLAKPEARVKGYHEEPNMTKFANYWITKLGLIAHPEGGYYRETYRASLSIAREALPAHFTGPRLVSTAIYFLLEGENFSAFHRLRSDELWHFYAGSPIVVHVIEEDGRHSEISIGNNPDEGETPQAVVKGGCWFASCVRDPESFALAGCTVAPGFDFEDFELGKRSDLVALYPQHRKLIEQLTRS
jgi:predicted cupin superfamily sugar epimerase